jgi:uncharacterized protein YuzE
MKLHDYPETDSLSIALTDAPGAQAREIVEGLVVDFDADGNVVGLDIDHASRKLDLSEVETIALPPASAARVIALRPAKLVAQRRRITNPPYGLRAYYPRPMNERMWLGSIVAS